MIRTVVILIVLSLTITSTSLAVTEVRSISTRPGVTMKFLYMAPDRTPLRDALILFPGGNGAIPFKTTKEGTTYGWNFLVRSADEFTRSGLAVVTVNPPSDHRTGLSTGFRESSEHAEDILKLAIYLGAQGFERIFLVGNSRGTLSVAALAGHLRDSHIQGAVLTSSLEYDNFMRWLPLENISMPVLMVHHRDDACRVSSFPEAERTRDSLRSHTKVDFVEVNGGAAAMSLPCNDLSSHGFFGIEAKVVKVIVDWINDRKIPARIE